MKKANLIINLLIGLSVGLWVIQALLSYNNYTRHIELYAAEGWLWYTDVLKWDKYIVPIVVVCIVAKFILRKK